MSIDILGPTLNDQLRQGFKFEAQWATFAFCFAEPGSFLIGSMLEQEANYIQYLNLSIESKRIFLRAQSQHTYPATKIMLAPNSDSIFASTSDILRLWKLENGQISFKAALAPHLENKEYNGPLTSFDWSLKDPSILGTSSIDKTCTIWDLNKSAIKKQILAHNNDVNDIAFSHDPNVFVSASSDFSVRKFDLRSLEQCSIIYENPRQTPIVRVCWSKVDPNYLGVLNQDSNTVVLLDIRNHQPPSLEIKGHNGGVNDFCWVPSSSNMCLAGEDCHMVIRDTKYNQSIRDNLIYIHNAEEKILGVACSSMNEIGMVLPSGVRYIKL